ncbi:CPBP family intramembrane glutamic endopeptidase [Butyricimonas synergistica]|nr:CPBP family intramembrane glutamic endopeptidase [Butyricimonas synergistica]
MFLEKAYRGNNKWYFYLLTLIIVFAAVQVASLPLALYYFIRDPQAALSGNTNNLLSITSTNLGLALMLFTFTAGVIALLICVKWLHHKQPLDILTGRSRFDIKRTLFGALIWGVLSFVLLGAQYGFGDTSNLVFQFKPFDFFMMCIVIVIFIPFQVAFEEFIFRGYLMQGSILLFKYRWVALVLTGCTFGLLHASNPEVERFGFWVAMPQYILMGLILGFVAIMDDGLELALGLHLSNNVISSIIVTHDSSALQTHALFLDTDPQASHVDTLVMLVCGIIFIWVCNRKYNFLSKINLWGKVLLRSS